MNFLIGKLGKSVLFNRGTWGPNGGDIDAPVFYENLLHRNPKDRFYMLGRSDFASLSASEKLRINKHGNLIDPWGSFAAYKRSFQGMIEQAEMRFVEEFMDSTGVKFDAGIMFAGPTGTTNIPGMVRLMKNPDKEATPLEMLGMYSAPIINYLNKYSDIPYVMIVNDPRYFPPFARDIFNWPKVVLSQYNSVVTVGQRTTYTDCTLIKKEIPEQYAEVETIFLMEQHYGKPNALPGGLESFFEDTPAVENGIKDIKFMIVLNEGKPSRYRLLDESILSAVDDVAVYGKWSDPATVGDNRFKGPLQFHGWRRKTSWVVKE